MEVKLDPRADAMYIRLTLEKPQKYTRRLDWRRVVDYAEDGTPVAVELLSISKGVDLTGLPQADLLQNILADHKVKILQT
jgi:uncharacterized protein YuzE